MVEWAKREYRKADIDRAGIALLPWWTSPTMKADEEVGKAFTIVENWRTSHAFPLNVFQNRLRVRAKKIQPQALIAQRLKRFSAVMNKLMREPHMKLSQMHDLGGCRAILNSIKEVEDVHEVYCGPLYSLPGITHREKCYDYIQNPKPDGYRGVHIVERYAARHEIHKPWDGQRIEIQLRTKLQHAFSTAVETVTTFTREPLKFGGGPDEWKRFFSLMGSAIALREGTPIVPNTPDNPTELIAALKDVSQSLMVRPRLQAWSSALRSIRRQNIRNFKWLLMVLDVSANTINVTGYTDRRKASEAVSAIEQSKQTNLDAVLVWVNSIKQLRAAYPNYYADTGAFVNALSVALGEELG
jgi:hypothetical protein